MLKLLSINIEKDCHRSTVMDLIHRENPDVVCLQEVPEYFTTELRKLGYMTTFAPMFLEDLPAGNCQVGIMLASRLPFECSSYYYYQPPLGLVILDETDKRKSISNVYLLAKVKRETGIYNIATTHMIDTKDGHTDSHQTMVMGNFLTAVEKEGPHVICGDFNMPRGHNVLYDDVTKLYTDAIPNAYLSSLDRSLHRLGNKIIDEPIFDEYMVDYVFTQAPYKAEKVKLEFGISDHAALIAEITKD